MSTEVHWEKCYRDGDMPWDHGAPSPGLVEYLDAQPLTGKVAVPGCGLGHDVAEIARRTSEVSVLGLDIAGHAAAAAARNLEPFNNASAEHGDLFRLGDSHAGVYDWVWEHTCFCAIGPHRRPEYVQAVFRMLKPGGALLGVFYLNPREREDRTDGPPFGCTVEELDTLFARRFSIGASWQPRTTYCGREGRELMRLLRKQIE